MTRNGYFGALATKLRRLPRPAAGVETEGPSADTFRTTHVLPDFVTEVRARTAPVVIDLGPAIGSNVAFLGQEFAGAAGQRVQRQRTGAASAAAGWKRRRHPVLGCA